MRQSCPGACRVEVVIGDATSAPVPKEVMAVPDHLHIEHIVGGAIGSALLALGMVVVVMSIGARRRGRDVADPPLDTGKEPYRTPHGFGQPNQMER